MPAAMLIYHRTSLLDSNAQTLVNTVNCVGVMGKGIAAAFKERHPDMFRAYRKLCEEKKLAPGLLWLWQNSRQWVLNFPTKVHWRRPSRLEWIDAGLQKFVQEYEKRGIVEISFPRLGCGNGGLDWEVVRPLMEHYLSRLPIQVYVHDYEVDLGTPEHLETANKNIEAASLRISYEHFIQALRVALEGVNGGIADLETKQKFQACLLLDDGLALERNGSSQIVHHDELRGVWASLQKGLLTRHAAEWVAGEGASRLLSVMSLLPEVRAVQVQRPPAEPEIAIELRQRRSVDTADCAHDKQMMLSWS